MSLRRISRFGIGLALALAAHAGTGPNGAQAQVVGGGQPLGQAQSGLQRPNFEPAGGWARILTVTDKWLVLENEDGQQFPVAFDQVNLFVMRWPTSAERIAPDDLLEVTGWDRGTNQIQTDHIDVFHGAARSLVTPTYQPIIGYGRVVTRFDIEQQNTLGINLHYRLLPGEERIPPRLHVVGPLASLIPLQIAIGGGNAVTVLPLEMGVTMTQVTPGVNSYVRPGDMAYVVPIPANATPRSLALAQLVVYKDVPLDRFAR
jgi:hypothetical protein